MLTNLIQPTSKFGVHPYYTTAKMEQRVVVDRVVMLNEHRMYSDRVKMITNGRRVLTTP